MQTSQFEYTYDPDLARMCLHIWLTDVELAKLQVEFVVNNYILRPPTIVRSGTRFYRQTPRVDILDPLTGTYIPIYRIELTLWEKVCAYFRSEDYEDFRNAKVKKAIKYWKKNPNALALAHLQNDITPL